ncbi:hypothetical protein M2T75_39565, partial [Klebsiella pneumoniae]|nr:hypothetical protein [Klebsiella pneumoniae]
LSSEGCNFSFVLLKHSKICLTVGGREEENWLSYDFIQAPRLSQGIPWEGQSLVDIADGLKI